MVMDLHVDSRVVEAFQKAGFEHLSPSGQAYLRQRLEQAADLVQDRTVNLGGVRELGYAELGVTHAIPLFNQLQHKPGLTRAQSTLQVNADYKAGYEQGLVDGKQKGSSQAALDAHAKPGSPHPWVPSSPLPPGKSASWVRGYNAGFAAGYKSGYASAQGPVKAASRRPDAQSLLHGVSESSLVFGLASFGSIDDAARALVQIAYRAAPRTWAEVGDVEMAALDRYPVLEEVSVKAADVYPGLDANKLGPLGLGMAEDGGLVTLALPDGAMSWADAIEGTPVTSPLGPEGWPTPAAMETFRKLAADWEAFDRIGVGEAVLSELASDAKAWRATRDAWTSGRLAPAAIGGALASEKGRASKVRHALREIGATDEALVEQRWAALTDDQKKAATVAWLLGTALEYAFYFWLFHGVWTLKNRVSKLEGGSSGSSGSGAS